VADRPGEADTAPAVVRAHSGQEPEASEALVRRLAAAALADPASLRALSPRELDLTIRLLRRARLLGRLAWRLRELDLTDTFAHPVPDILASALVGSEARARVARWELDRVAWALGDEAPAPLVVLKGGAYLLTGTPNAAGRMFADVDLLVSQAELRKTEARLHAMGWQGTTLTPYDERYYRDWAHELPPMTHREREVEIDLHHNILMSTARLRPDARLLVEAARQVPGTVYSVLAPEDMTLHAMTHLFYSGEMDDGLRELVDIHDLLSHFGEHEPGFWQRFWRRAEQLDLARPAFYGLRYAHRFLGTQVPDAVREASAAGAPPAPVLALMDRLVPLALFPPHPDVLSRWVALARFGLFVRSHWVRMPPLMLARHLGHKFRVRYLKRPVAAA